MTAFTRSSDAGVHRDRRALADQHSFQDYSGTFPMEPEHWMTRGLQTTANKVERLHTLARALLGCGPMNAPTGNGVGFHP
ncbi:hypothetical protein HYQ46_008500 [Verticillium longisporum]|nr:hypothetical protein HYQ44_011744 [Verticillium longisporum]KAG7137549.1 hypothetical protein HYQ46_008500 [Verticillium longisporum]